MKGLRECSNLIMPVARRLYYVPFFCAFTHSGIDIFPVRSEMNILYS